MTEIRDPGITFAEITTGAQNMVFMILDRIHELEDAVRSGDFIVAQQRGNELMHKVASLANAQSTIGVFSDCVVVRATELNEGDELFGMGVVATVTQEPCAAPGHANDGHVHVTVTFTDGGEDSNFIGHQELLKMRGSA